MNVIYAKEILEIMFLMSKKILNVYMHIAARKSVDTVYTLLEVNHF